MNDSATLPEPLERQRRWLGFAGLGPFVACLAVVLVTDAAALESAAVDAMLHYAAVIAAFLGAVHWGLSATHETARGWRLWWGVTPALVAWALLAAPQDLALVGFAGLFAVVLAVDLRWLSVPDPGYRALRLPLTAVVVGVLLATAVEYAGA